MRSFYRVVFNLLHVTSAHGVCGEEIINTTLRQMEYTRAKNFNMKTTSFTQTHKPDYSVFHCQKPRRPGRYPYEPF